MKMHTDVFGNVLNIGDTVATTFSFRKSGWNSRLSSNLKVAEVIGFSKQKIRIKYVDIDGADKTTTKYSNQLSKRFEVNLFKDSQDYLLNSLGMTMQDAIDTAKWIYEEEVSRMDY